MYAKQKFVSTCRDKMCTDIPPSEGTHDPAIKAVTYDPEMRSKSQDDGD